MDKQVNVYKSNGEWCYALIVDGEHDHSDTLDVEDGADDAAAIAQASLVFDGATIKRVEDVRV